MPTTAFVRIVCHSFLTPYDNGVQPTSITKFQRDVAVISLALSNTDVANIWNF